MKIDFTIRECPEFLLEVLPPLVALLVDGDNLYYEHHEHGENIARLMSVLADEFSGMEIENPEHEELIDRNKYTKRVSAALLNCQKEIYAAQAEYDNRQ